MNTLYIKKNLGFLNFNVTHSTIEHIDSGIRPIVAEPVKTLLQNRWIH
jgi:hypothetical protein